MDIIKNYGNYIKKNINDNPQKSWDLICTGIAANKVKTNLIPSKKYSKGNQKLEHLIMKMSTDAFYNLDGAIYLLLLKSFKPLDLKPFQ